MRRTDVLMPQMGESVTEGTIVRWIRQAGDRVERDSPLFEISTDKVDAEVPSPATGILADVRIAEGQTVAVRTVLAAIVAETAGQSAADSPAASANAPTGASVRMDVDVPTDASAPIDTRATAARPAPRQRSSPLVRRIARDHHVDLHDVRATGVSGRITKRDILAHLGHRDAPSTRITPSLSPGSASVADDHETRVEREPLSAMRRAIAEHMVRSARTSPHAYAVYEIDFGRLSAFRDARKPEFERLGAKLTFTALIARVFVDALVHFPILNASLDGDIIIRTKDVHLGIAVALDRGLIVPVIKHAGEKNLLGLCRSIEDLATRARTKALRADEVQGGTSTLTNTGTFGGLHTLPLIHQPQVAILGVGGIARRPVVVGDAIAIRPVCHLTLGFDHRLIDGADAGRVLTFMKDRLEQFDEPWW